MNGELRHPHDFFPFFLVRGSGSSPSTIESNHSAAAWRDHPESTSEEDEWSSHLPVQLGKPNDYHISQHVASTFKSLCATHHDLNNFSLHRWGVTSTTTPSAILTLLQNVQSSNSSNLASSRKLLDFYRSYLTMQLVELNRVNITSEPKNMHLRLQTTPENLNAQIKLLQQYTLNE